MLRAFTSLPACTILSVFRCPVGPKAVTETDRKLPDRCADGCESCRKAELCAAPDGPSGGRLVLSSAWAFLLPVVLAGAGAAVFADGGTRQFLAAAGGFAVGLAAAVGLSAALRGWLEGRT